MDESIKNERLKTQKQDKVVRNFERIFAFIVPVLTVGGAFLVSSLLLAAVGVSPAKGFGALIDGAFGSLYATSSTLDRAIPLILAGLGIAIGIKGGIFNLGGEGQIAVGGIFATFIGIHPLGLPSFILIPLGLLASFIGGGILGGIPGYLNAKYNINTIISSIMLNYIGLAAVSLMVKGPMQAPGGIDIQSPKVDPAAILPILIPGTRLHAGLLVAIVMAVLTYILIFRTPFGYELRIIGQNENTARYSGINVAWVKFIGFIISGGLCGLAGGVEILGYQYRLREAFLLNYGYDAIAVALLGQANPFGILLSGTLFGSLQTGASAMQRATQLSQSLAMVIQAIIILFVAGSAILMVLPRFYLKRRAQK